LSIEENVALACEAWATFSLPRRRRFHIDLVRAGWLVMALLIFYIFSQL
jgi:hypothetical protein